MKKSCSFNISVSCSELIAITLILIGSAIAIIPLAISMDYHINGDILYPCILVGKGTTLFGASFGIVDNKSGRKFAAYSGIVSIILGVIGFITG